MVTKAIHFGGGNIGRGFVAEKLALTGYEVRKPLRYLLWNAKAEDRHKSRLGDPQRLM